MRLKIYNAIKNADGWIDIDDLVKIICLNRTSLAGTVRSMINQFPHKYPGLEVFSKRKKAAGKFGSQKAAYNIKYRWVSDGK